jgi:hypothetical protein
MISLPICGAVWPECVRVREGDGISPADVTFVDFAAGGTDLDLRCKLAYSYITLNAQGWDRAGSIQHAGCRDIPVSPSVIYTARGRGALHGNRYKIEKIFMAN